MSTNHITTCRKCKGSGYLACMAHVDNGRCWACGGKGTRDRAAERAHADKVAEAQALPAMNDLIEHARSTGMRYREADKAARIFQRVHLDRIWDEDSFTSRGITDEDIAAAVALFDGMVPA